MTRHEEEYIMFNFRAGTKCGFELMYHTFYLHLLHFAVSIIKDEECAKDIVICVLQRVFEKHKDFEAFTNAKAYLFISVKNKCLRYIEHKKKFNQEQYAYDEPIPTEDLIDAKMVRSEFLQKIYIEIEALPPVRKEVFKLFYLEDLSIAEIAKKLNMTRDAASNNKLKAIKQLKRVLSLKKITYIHET